MITRDTVRHVAKLARLAFTPDEEARLTEELGSILGYVEQLAEVDTAGVEPTAHPLPLANVLRPDEPHACLSREEALRNASAAEAGMFRVPRILSE